MADKHPYVTSPGSLVQVVTQFRKSFPATVSAKTLKKLGIAPNNESYVLNVLRFLALIDQEGNRTTEAQKIFSLHDDAAFTEAFAAKVSKAYVNLFDLHSDSAWDLGTDALITFFRSQDETTAIVGKLQASTFKILAAYSGHGDVPGPKTPGSKGDKPASKGPKKAAATQLLLVSPTSAQAKKKDVEPAAVGLTVRIEVNLPADGDQATYDRIFKSIRENLLNG